jgi:N-terminal acetyltransferase 2
MIRTSLQTLRPFLQLSRTAAIRSGQIDAPARIGIVELWSLRRAFSSGSRTPITRFTQQRISGGSRSRLTTKPSSPLRTKQNKRSFHRSSRLREDSKPDPSKTKAGEPEQPLSLSARLKKLSREYGWSAVGVYFALSVLDFPFCFLLVRVVGTERIGEKKSSPNPSKAKTEILSSKEE